MRKFPNKFQGNKGRRPGKRPYAKKRPPQPVIDYNELMPWKVDTSRSLFASFSHRTVRCRHGESNEGLLKRFKSMVEKSGLIADIKKREFYKSKGERRREKTMKAQKRALKNMVKKARFK